MSKVNLVFEGNVSVGCGRVIDIAAGVDANITARENLTHGCGTFLYVREHAQEVRRALGISDAVADERLAAAVDDAVSRLDASASAEQNAPRVRTSKLFELLPIAADLITVATFLMQMIPPAH